MTDWTKIVSGNDLIEAAKERATPVYKVSNIKEIDIHKYEDEGWSILKTVKNGTSTLQKNKRLCDQFENEVWTIFYKMGFTYLNKANDFSVDLNGNSKQVDVIAIDDETCIIVECKATEKMDKTTSFKKELESIHGYYLDLVQAIKSQYGNHLKFKFVFATRNYYIADDSADAERMKSFDITYFDYDTVLYYKALVDHLGKAAKYQLQGNLFQKTKIKNLENRVCALKGNMGGIDYYMFSIEPERLLKMSYILHRTKANHLMMPTYQRLIKKDRLKAIREFIDNGGYFPNSIIVTIDTNKKGLQFDYNSPVDFETSVKSGILHLPQNYRSMFVIDGQHRLYGYSESKYANNNVIPVVAFIDLLPEEQVKMFMDINENQKSVSKSLRNTLNIDLLWNSSNPKSRKDALMLKVAEALGEEAASPLYKRIVTGEDNPTDIRCITTEYIKDAIKDSSFLNEYTKSDIKRIGTLDRNDNDKTFDELFNFLVKCFSTISDLCDTEWNDSKNGFLAINNTTYALIRLFDDIVNIQLKKLSQNVITSIDTIYKKCEDMLLELADVIQTLPIEQRIAIKTAKGGSAKKNSWRTLQVALNSKDADFINADLQTYIDTHCTNNNPESNEYIEKIENKIIEGFKGYLHDHDSWVAKVPETLGKAIARNLAEENYKREKIGQPLVDEWHFVSFDEIQKISIYSNNWTTFAQSILTRPSLKNSQTNTLTWLKDLASYKNKLNNGLSLSKNDFKELEIIYNDLVGETDATNN